MNYRAASCAVSVAQLSDPLIFSPIIHLKTMPALKRPIVSTIGLL